MRIEIINKEGELITDFELESNPFKVGETLSLSVSNHNKDFWTVDDLRGDYKVEKIEHFLRKEYTRSKKVSTVFSVSVQVSELS